MTNSERKKIPPEMMAVDHRYQRPLNDRRADRIAKKFDPRRFGVPVVSDRGNCKFYIIDGQHSIEARRRAGDHSPVECTVVSGLTLAEEADLFLKLQEDREPVAAYPKFYAAVQAGDPETTKINGMVRASGLQVGPAPGSRTVAAVQALRFCHKAGTLDQVLSVVSVWAEGDCSAFDGNILRSLSHFFSAYPGADVAHLIKRLEPVHPKKAILRIKRLRAGGEFTSGEAATEYFRTVYNAHRPGKNRLPPRA